MDLAVSPIDATFLMERLPGTKCSVMGLAPELEDWIGSRLKVRDGFAKKLPNAVDTARRWAANTIMVTPGAHETFLRHDARLVAPFLARLVTAGWDILRARTCNSELEADLLALRAGRPRLVEAKTVSAGDGRQEILYAIGQLLDYEHFLVPHLVATARRRADRLILMERRPGPGLAGFAESNGFLVAWLKKGRQFEAGHGSSRRLAGILS